MGFSKVNVMILVLLSVNFAYSKTVFTASSARDDVNVESVESVVKEATIPIDDARLDTPVSGRVSCPHDEATEDLLCQEHCLPKGYSYGICVSKTCSCI